MIQYQIVQVSEWGASPLVQLEEQVRRLINHGWEPSGNVCHTFQKGWTGYGQTMTQAMIRHVNAEEYSS